MRKLILLVVLVLALLVPIVASAGVQSKRPVVNGVTVWWQTSTTALVSTSASGATPGDSCARASFGAPKSSYTEGGSLYVYCAV